MAPSAAVTASHTKVALLDPMIWGDGLRCEHEPPHPMPRLKAGVRKDRDAPDCESSVGFVAEHRDILTRGIEPPVGPKVETVSDSESRL